MSNIEEKSVRIIEFGGKQADWDGWSEKFLARAKRRGYKGLLLGRDKVPTQEQLDLAETSSSDSDKKILKLGELNELAYEDIVLSINHTTSSGKVAFSLIKNCKSDDFPEGNCKLAWERLVKKYEPHTAPKLLKLKKEFTNKRVEDVSQDLDEWITELESLRVQMDNIDIASKMTDRDLMIHIMNSLPEQYDPIVDNLEIRLMKKDDDPEKLTLDDLREKLSDRYARIIDKEEHKNEQDKGLSGNFQKQFKGTCRYCGKFGHKAIECRSRLQDEARNHQNSSSNTVRHQGNQDNRKFMGKCFNCGKVGHRKSECKKEMANKSREKIEESDEEDYGLVFYDTSNDSEQCKRKVKFKEIPEVIPDIGQLCTIDGHQYHTFNKNSWIGDTGASCFITYDDTNMYDVTKINEKIVGISGNVTATKMGKILGHVKQVDGTESIVEMYPVKYCPRATKKLFSITAFLSTGSKLQSDDANNIEMTSKDGTKVTFD